MSLVLAAAAKLYKHPKSQTLYVTIPSKVVQDSTFVFKPGEQVVIRYDPKTKKIIIEAAPQQERSLGERHNTKSIRSGEKEEDKKHVQQS